MKLPLTSTNNTLHISHTRLRYFQKRKSIVMVNKFAEKKRKSVKCSYERQATIFIRDRLPGGLHLSLKSVSPFYHSVRILKIISASFERDDAQNIQMNKDLNLDSPLASIAHRKRPQTY